MRKPTIRAAQASKPVAHGQAQVGEGNAVLGSCVRRTLHTALSRNLEMTTGRRSAGLSRLSPGTPLRTETRCPTRLGLASAKPPFRPHSEEEQTHFVWQDV